MRLNKAEYVSCKAVVFAYLSVILCVYIMHMTSFFRKVRPVSIYILCGLRSTFKLKSGPLRGCALRYWRFCELTSSCWGLVLALFDAHTFQNYLAADS